MSKEKPKGKSKVERKTERKTERKDNSLTDDDSLTDEELGQATGGSLRTSPRTGGLD
jgi:hypothetical protein